MAAGPSGLPGAAAATAASGFFLIATFEPAFSGAPCSIHLLIRSSLAPGSLSCFGGILGSSVWLTSAHSRELSRSPASTTSPLEPPAIALR